MISAAVSPTFSHADGQYPLLRKLLLLLALLDFDDAAVARVLVLDAYPAAVANVADALVPPLVQAFRCVVIFARMKTIVLIDYYLSRAYYSCWFCRGWKFQIKVTFSFCSLSCICNSVHQSVLSFSLAFCPFSCPCTFDISHPSL